MLVAIFQHFHMDRPRHHITRGQVFPVRRVAVHKWLAIRRQQHAAFAAHRLADQQIGRAAHA